MADSLRVGLIGLGKMGQIRARELAGHPKVRIVAGYDDRTQARAAFSYGQALGTAQEVLAAGIDAVFVCTPNAFTPGLVEAALDAGVHVFAEKPPGRTMADIERIRAAEARNPRLKLKFGFNHRYHAGIQEAKRIIDGGRLGRILWMRGVYGKAGGHQFETEWRSSVELSGGGILLDQGIHMLDLFRFFCGDFAEVKSMVSTSYWNLPVEDNAFALLRDEAGRIAMLHSSSTQWKHRFNLELYTSEGFLAVNGILSSTRSYGDETITIGRKAVEPGAPMGKPREETLYFDTDPSWELEVAEFVDAVLNDVPIRHGTSADAWAAMDLVYRIYGADSKWTESRTAVGAAPTISSPGER